MKKGFTLIEILVVMTLIGILAAIVVPRHRAAIVLAKEAVLEENLFQMRKAINMYYFDKQQYPTALEDLVGKYLTKIPLDPFTKNSEWELVRFEPEDMEDFDTEIMEGIIDIKSFSQKTGHNGTKYSDW